MGGVWIATAGEIAAHVASLGLAPVVHRRPVLPSLSGPAVAPRGGPAPT
jgi:hypothetical protein